MILMKSERIKVVKHSWQDCFITVYHSLVFQRNSVSGHRQNAALTEKISQQIQN